MAKACTLKLDKRRELNDGTYPVKLVVGNGTNLLLSTGVFVSEDEWDETEQKVVNRPMAAYYNKLLSDMLVTVYSRILRLERLGALKIPEQLEKGFLRKVLTASDMEQAFSEGAERMKKEDEEKYNDAHPDFYTIAERCIRTKDNKHTRSLYELTLRKVRAFTDNTPLRVEDMDRVWLHDFSASLGGKLNARATHMRNVRAICNFALDEGYTTYYPFRKFSIKYEETRKKALTVEQVRAFMNAEGLSVWEQEHRDIFILLIYLRGINVGDLAGLTQDSIVNGRLEYRRNKTGALYSVRLEPEALEIIGRHRGQYHLLDAFDRYKDHRDYNHHLGDALKRMKAPGGLVIEKDCSSNWARHTWATLAAEIDIPDPTISLGMGHRIAGHRTTAVYIKRDQKKVDEANRKVIDYILGRS